MKKILFVAGDRSGDLFAGKICKRLKELYKDQLLIFSFGGDSLKGNSIQLIDLVNFSISGILEVTSYLKKFLQLLNISIVKIKDIKPDLIILVDFPDFNLRLAKMLQKRFNLLYYISPQVWAWRRKRVETIKEFVGKIVVIFPFEKKIYEEEGIETYYFGHPLLDIIPPLTHQPQNIIAFLPGSRKNEIKRHLPVMLKTKRILEEKFPHHRFPIVKPPHIQKDFYCQFSSQIDVVPFSYEFLSKTKFVIASSGTVTVETAIIGIPFIAIYRLNTLSWLILRNIVKIDFIAMPNIIVGKKIAEEFIQNDANPKNLANHTFEILNDEKKYYGIKEELKKVKEILGPPGSIENTARLIGEKLLNLSQKDKNAYDQKDTST